MDADISISCLTVRFMTGALIFGEFFLLVDEGYLWGEELVGKSLLIFKLKSHILPKSSLQLINIWNNFDIEVRVCVIEFCWSIRDLPL